MIRKIIIAALLLGVSVYSMAAASPARRHEDVGARMCRVEVLHSEELPVGPMFYHTVKSTLQVTPLGEAPVVRSVEKVIPWQVPPPRQGQKMTLACDDPQVIGSTFFGLPLP